MSGVLEVSFRGRSTREIRAARAWRTENLGASRTAEMDEELRDALWLLQRFPFMGSLAPGSTAVRRVLLERCGYHLYYRVSPGEIQVLRFWHQKRRSPRV
jgi:plasmid stabilization system protein ParE